MESTVSNRLKGGAADRAMSSVQPAPSSLLAWEGAGLEATESVRMWSCPKTTKKTSKSIGQEMSIRLEQSKRNKKLRTLPKQSPKADDH